MEFELNYQNRPLICSLEQCDWSLGIGVLVRFYEDNQAVGALKFLCDSSHERYEEISLLSIDRIFDHIKSSLENEMLHSFIGKLVHWQSEMSKQGFKGVSPLYVQLTDAI